MTLEPVPISIELMLPSDIDAVQEIDRICYPTPWFLGVYKTELSNRAATYFVARRNGVVVGYAGAWVIRTEAHITTIAVHPSNQRQKIGERLLTSVISEAIDRRAKLITLEVREGNRPAIELYRKYGFVETATRRNYYQDNNENATVMWASDIQSEGFRRRFQSARLNLATALGYATPI